jgi:hypothetical protein
MDEDFESSYAELPVERKSELFDEAMLVFARRDAVVIDNLKQMRDKLETAMWSRSTSKRARIMEALVTLNDVLEVMGPSIRMREEAIRLLKRLPPPADERAPNGAADPR